jgi:hypothetical protein
MTYVAHSAQLSGSEFLDKAPTYGRSGFQVIIPTSEVAEAIRAWLTSLWPVSRVALFMTIRKSYFRYINS